MINLHGIVQRLLFLVWLILFTNAEQPTRFTQNILRFF